MLKNGILIQSIADYCNVLKPKNSDVYAINLQISLGHIIFVVAINYVHNSTYIVCFEGPVNGLSRQGRILSAYSETKIVGALSCRKGCLKEFIEAILNISVKSASMRLSLVSESY